MSNIIKENRVSNLITSCNQDGLSTAQTVAVGVFIALLMIPVFTSILDISKTAQQNVQETEQSKDEQSTGPSVAASYTASTNNNVGHAPKQDYNVLYDTGGKRKCYDPPMTKECGAGAVYR